MNYTAEIGIDAEKSISLNENIFGHFIEHLGDCVYDGVWDERKVASEYEFGRVRKDVFHALKDLRPSVLRWPGGCFSDGYNWRLGVGQKRRRVLNRAWWRIPPARTVFESNHFGTDEFMELCRRLGAKPYININLGSGSPRDAADWVEYCNGTDSPLADLRSRNGNSSAYGVQLWGIGNETWGPHEIGWQTNGKRYAKKYLEYRREMKKADPGIETVAVGANRLYPKWNREFLSIAGGEAEYLALHEYAPHVLPVMHRACFFGYPDSESEYYTMIAGADMFEDSILGMQDAIDAAGSRVRIAFDEWNAWWSFGQIHRAEDYTVREALLVASTLCRLIKFSQIIGISNISMAVNCLGLILTYPQGVVLTPSYLAYKMIRGTAHSHVLDVSVSCDAVNTRAMGMIPAQTRMPLIDAACTLDHGSGRLSLIAVNKHISEPVAMKACFRCFAPSQTAGVKCMRSESPFDKNTLGQPGRVSMEESTRDYRENESFTLPPHSVSVFEFSRR